MRKQTSRRSALAFAMTLVTFSLGLLVAVFVAGSATASSPLPSTTETTTSSSPSMTGSSMMGFDPNSPQAQFLVVNGTVNAASDHEIVGSSAFPNFTTGAVDNYYSMSRSHMDNSPFSEATASPLDTGPIGQTAAAGNFQQSQYADARWPGGPDKATYGKSGNPFAEAGAYESVATADASDASNALSGPGLDGSKTLAVPKGFDSRLQQALAGWKEKYLGCPTAPTLPAPPTVKLPPPPKVTVPKTPTVTSPAPKVTTPIVTVAAPSTAGSAPPTPSAPAPALPSAGTPDGARSLSAASSCSSASSSSGSDGESLLTSSALGVLVPGSASTNTDIAKVNTTELETTQTATTTTQTDTTLTGTTPTAWVPKPYTLMMGGESRMGRVVLGNGQIVIDGIHVTASVENDGTATPSYKAAISVASASIGGVPVTIDQDGVSIAGHANGLPYKQASDSLNTALKQAGIQLFLVAPQVTNCGPPSSGTGTNSTTTTTTTTSTTSDQSGATSPCDQGAGAMCDTGMGTGTDTTSTTTTTTTSSSTSTDQSGMGVPPATCPPPSSCGTGTATGGTGYGGSTTTTTTSTPTPAPTSTTTSTGQTDTTSTTSSFCPPPDSCGPAGMTGGPSPGGGGTTTTTTTTTTTGQTGTTGTTGTAPSSCPPPLSPCPTSGKGKAPGTATSTAPTTSTPTTTTDQGPLGPQETILLATGVHVVFTQPVSPSGVPAQFVEHILGDVYIDSLAEPAAPLPALAPFPGSLSSLSSSSGGASSCLGKRSRSKTLAGGGGTSGGASGGSSLGGGGSSASGSLSPSGSALGSSSQTSGGSTGNSLPASFAAALRKPLWLLLAYLVWQALVIGTGLSLWNWRREGES